MIVLPTEPLPEVTAPVLVSTRPGAAARDTVAGAVLVTAAPVGGAPEPVAVLLTAPEFTSVCEMTDVAVAVTVCPGCRTPAVPLGQVP